MSVNMKKINAFLTDYAIYVVLVVLVIGISISNPDFLSLSTLTNILHQNSTKAIIALGAAFVLITGGVDLSAGRMVGFAAVISAHEALCEPFGEGDLKVAQHEGFSSADAGDRDAAVLRGHARSFP